MIKKILILCIFAAFSLACNGCRSAWSDSDDPSGIKYPAEEAASSTDGPTQEAGTETPTEVSIASEETSMEEDQIPAGWESPDGYIYVNDDLTLKKLEGYAYQTSRGHETPFSVSRTEEDGSVSYFSMTQNWLIYDWQSCLELKKADSMYFWHDTLLDGWLEEYRELSDGVGLSIYLYETRQPFGLSEFETHVPEYGYRAYYSMDGSRYAYTIHFPVAMTFDEVNEFLDSIQIGSGMFLFQKKGGWTTTKIPKEPETDDTLDGLFLTELRECDYTYMKRSRKMIPFRAMKKEGEGSGIAFEMVRAMFPSGKMSYDELKKAENIKEWYIGCGIIEGPLVSFQSFDNGVGLSLYEYKTRGEWIETYHKNTFPEYSYIALYGMSQADYVYAIFFPKDMPLEDVEKFLDSIEVGVELFS